MFECKKAQLMLLVRVQCWWVCQQQMAVRELDYMLQHTYVRALQVR